MFTYKAIKWEDTPRGKIAVIALPIGHLFPEVGQRITIDNQSWVVLAVNSYVPPNGKVALLVQ
jgi:hypothetical protein